METATHAQCLALEGLCPDPPGEPCPWQSASAGFSDFTWGCPLPPPFAFQQEVPTPLLLGSGATSGPRLSCFTPQWRFEGQEETLGEGKCQISGENTSSPEHSLYWCAK